MSDDEEDNNHDTDLVKHNKIQDKFLNKFNVDLFVKTVLTDLNMNRTKFTLFQTMSNTSEIKSMSMLRYFQLII